MKKRILLLGSQMETAGAQRVLLDQAEWLSKKGFNVKVVFFYDKEGVFHEYLRTYQFQIVNLRADQKEGKRLRNLFQAIKGGYRLLRLLSRGRFDAIETFTHDSNIIGLPLAYCLGIPKRIGTHHGRIESIPNWRVRFNTWLVNNGIATDFIAVSNRVKTQAIDEGINPDRIVVIPNGVKEPDYGADENVSIFLREEAEVDIIILGAGRLTYQKGHENLIRAAVTVLDQVPRATFAIAGDGPLAGYLNDLITDLDLQNKFTLLGIRKDLSALMKSADIFALPSRFEGLPLVVLEAMMTETAVVATDIEGIDEVIEDGVSGLIVPVEDISALAEAIIQLASDADYRNRIASAGYKTAAAGFTVEKMCERYKKVIESV